MNNITELRTHLFDTLRGLKNGSMKIETAQAINDTAQIIVNTAKVEVDHMKVAGGFSGFIVEGGSSTTTTKTQGGVKIVTNGGAVTKHVMAR